MQLEDDDLPIGRILSRRDALRLLALSGGAVLVGCRPRGEAAAFDSTGVAGAANTQTAAGSLPKCVAKPELTVGPYFLDKQLERADIRIEPATSLIKPGAPLRLSFNVQQIANGNCAPLSGAMVDLWQCDAAGVYSGVTDSMVGFDTSGQKFLRGYQITDNAGVARFTTIYPGWYQGRAVHIHFKIRTPATGAIEDQPDKTYEFTSQLFFDEALTDQVHALQPYAAKGRRNVRNANDGIFRQAGDSLMLTAAKAGDGYDATFDVGLDLTDTETGKADRAGRGRGGPGGRRGRPPS